MKKIFYLILIFIVLAFYLAPVSLADGGFFFPLYRDMYEPNQLAMIVFDDMVEKIIFQIDYEGDAEDFAWVVPVPGYPKLFSVEDDIFYEFIHQTNSNNLVGNHCFVLLNQKLISKNNKIFIYLFNDYINYIN